MARYKNFREYCLFREESSASDAAAEILDKMGMGDYSLAKLRRRPSTDTATARSDSTLSSPEEKELPDKYYKAILNRPVYDTRTKNQPESEPASEPERTNPIAGWTRNPWPNDADVKNYTPPKGQFGYGKRTPDFFGQASKSTNPNYKAKYNQYQPTHEEEEMIVQLAQQGHQPLGITLQLGDRLGKMVPAHVVKSVLDKAGLS